MEEKRRCYVCKEIKFFSEFRKNNTKKYGISYECKSCSSILSREYYKKNKERIDDYRKEYYKKYRKNNNRKIKKYNKNYYQKNKEKYTYNANFLSSEEKQEIKNNVIKELYKKLFKNNN